MIGLDAVLLAGSAAVWVLTSAACLVALHDRSRRRWRR